MAVFLVDFEQGGRGSSLHLETEDWDDAEEKLRALQASAEVMGRLILEGRCKGVLTSAHVGHC